MGNWRRFRASLLGRRQLQVLFRPLAWLGMKDAPHLRLSNSLRRGLERPFGLIQEGRGTERCASPQMDSVALLSQPIEIRLQSRGHDAEFAGDADQPPHALLGKKSIRLGWIPGERLPLGVWIDPLIPGADGV